MVERRGCSRRGAGRNARARPRAVSLREKGRVSRPIYWASVYNQYAVTEPSLCLCPSLTELEHGRLTWPAPQGAGVTGTVESGGRQPTGGPVRSNWNLKEPRSSRVSRPFGTRSITGRTI